MYQNPQQHINDKKENTNPYNFEDSHTTTVNGGQGLLTNATNLKKDKRP